MELPCLPTLQEDFYPLKKFLQRYFHIINTEEHKRKGVFEHIYAALIRRFRVKIEKFDEKEFLRIKTIIGVLAGLDFSDAAIFKLDSKERKYQYEKALTFFLAHLNMIKPVVLYIEDAQWLDIRTKEYFQEELESLCHKFGLKLLVTTTLETNLSQEIFELEIESWAMPLGGIELCATKELIETVLENEIDEELLQLVQAKSSGIPLYIEEICSYLEENGLLYIENEQFTIDSSSIEHVPNNISSLIVSRFNNLPPQLIKIIKIAVVGGKEVDRELLKDVLAHTDWTEFVEESFDALLQLGEQYGIWHLLENQSLWFKHQMFVDAIYHMVMPKKIQKTHLAYARALEEESRSLPRLYESVAYHFEAGEAFSDSVSFYRMAGEFEHEQNFNYYKSIQNFEKALLNYDRCGGQSVITLGRIKMSMLKAYYDLHDFQKVTEIGAPLISDLEASHMESISMYGDLLHLMGRCHVKEHQHEEAAACAKKLLGVKKEFYGQSILGLLRIEQGDFDQAETYLSEALALADNNPKDQVQSYENLGLLFSTKGNLQKAAENYNQSVKLSEQVGRDEVSIAKNKFNIGTIYSLQGLVQESVEIFQEVAQLFEDRLGSIILT